MKYLFANPPKFLQYFPEMISRLTIGFIFIESGVGKIQNLPKVISYFESLQIPFASIQAPIVSYTELILGGCILLGFLTRLAALPLILIMIVALGTAKTEEITNFSALLGLSEFLYILILLWLFSNGSGVLSIDHLVLKQLNKSKAH